MFVINPEHWSIPTYRIGPFRTLDIALNNSLPPDNSIELYFRERFYGRTYYYTINGRSAIGEALSYYKLKRNDIVTILSTSGNLYIAKCVTDEIEKICNWSRKIESGTRVILVNHEFGYPFKELERVKRKGIPIIEDCAHSFFSNNDSNIIGKAGDFAVYSFPKIFPIQVGGLLVANISAETLSRPPITDEMDQYIKNVLSHYIKQKDIIIKKRIKNYLFLRQKFKEFGFNERFPLERGIVPGVYMFTDKKSGINFPKLKEYFYAHGVQCSVFYGEKSFFVPVHQALDEQDLEYFYEVMRSFV